MNVKDLYDIEGPYISKHLELELDVMARMLPSQGSMRHVMRTASERIASAMAVLRKVEWGGCETDQYGNATGTACPCCGGSEPVHQKGCALAEILAQAEGRA